MCSYTATLLELSFPYAYARPYDVVNVTAHRLYYKTWILSYKDQPLHPAMEFVTRRLYFWHEMAESSTEGENTVTAVEYLENQLALEKEAAAILPGKFESCTFKLGFIRQAVYACKTCSALDPANPAGMCYGCSIACHADHEVLELFPKRNFRCDCGLKNKFGGNTCELDMDSKVATRNEDNTYNHNFLGRYCR